MHAMRVYRHGFADVLLRRPGTHECDAPGCGRRGYYRRAFDLVLCAAHAARMRRGCLDLDAPLRIYEHQRVSGAVWPD